MRPPRPARFPNYALIFATDDYAHWPHLTNPILDADAVNKTLASLYGFEVEEIRNPTSEQILLKLNDYLHRKFAVQDQLLIFFSGHGYFDDDLGQGFIVPADAQSVSADPIHRNRLAYDDQRDVNRIPATHIVLIADACFAGTLDRKIADSGLRGDTTIFTPMPPCRSCLRARSPSALAGTLHRAAKTLCRMACLDIIPRSSQRFWSPSTRAPTAKGISLWATFSRVSTPSILSLAGATFKDENEPGADFILLTPAAIAQLSLSN